MSESARVIPWSGDAPPAEGELKALMERGNLTPYSWSNAPGDEYPPHSHGYGKVIYVVDGSITWIFPATGRRIETRRGDRLELESGVVHAALVGSEGVSCLEAHR